MLQSPWAGLQLVTGPLCIVLSYSQLTLYQVQGQVAAVAPAS